jgi:hypothetical protein
MPRRVAACFACWLWLAPAGAADDGVRNPFHDPFLQLTSGLAACTTPEEPVYGADELKALAHERSQRGVSCWLAGRCRLHNAYLYDAEIIPRVRIAVLDSQRFDDTSVWALGQRRHVWLKGCVRSDAQARELEATVRQLDDVEDVHLELSVGAALSAPYVVRHH